MKKLIGLAVICLFAFSAAAFAGTPQTATSTVNATVGTVFSMAWEDNGSYVLYPNGGPLPFSSVDPASSLNYVDGHLTTKPDIALKCKSNEATTWRLKASVAGPLSTKMLYYMGQPTVDAVATNGVLTNPTPGVGQPWPSIPVAIGNLYTCGTSDKINTPNGTYVGMGIGVNGGGLTQGTYNGTVITFTMTQAA